MHADALPPPQQREPGWGLPLALALLVHLLVALVFIVAWFWSPERNTDAAAGLRSCRGRGACQGR